MLISIVIPTRNEELDIGLTLEACLAIDYSPKEIVVVDDSSDRTPEIVTSFAARGVKLLHREKNRNGCCGARNAGLQAARGEVVVMLNADDVPSVDFLKRLARRYENGADYVVVRSRVRNRENLWSNFIAVNEDHWYASAKATEWSEGFSCRREAAEAVGMIPGDFAIPFCRDWLLGISLRNAGYRKDTAIDIDMEHVCPATASAFWRNQIWRGSMTVPHTYYLRQMSVGRVLLREAMRNTAKVVSLSLVIPDIARAIRLSGYSTRGLRDAPGIWLASVVGNVARLVGAFRSARELLRVEGFNIGERSST